MYLSVDQPTNRNGETYVKISCFADSVKHVELQIRQHKDDNWIPIVEAKVSEAHLRTFLRKADYNLGQVSVISQDGLCYENMCNVDVTMRVHVKPGIVSRILVRTPVSDVILLMVVLPFTVQRVVFWR